MSDQYKYKNSRSCYLHDSQKDETIVQHDWSEAGGETLRCARCMVTMSVSHGGRRVDSKILGERAEDVAQVVQTLLRANGIQVSVTGGNIGILNLGEIEDVESITVNAQVLASTGNGEIAEALASIIDRLLNTPDIGEPVRAEALEQIRELSRQALLPDGERAKKGVLKALIAGAGATLQTAAAVAQVWSVWGPRISAYFGIV